MEDRWIYLPEGGYPKNNTKVYVLLLELFRDPYYDKGEPGEAFVTSATFTQENDGTRKWHNVGDASTVIQNESHYFESFDIVNEDHPDESWDSYIIAWQPMPTVPKEIMWPERKPVSRVTQILQCPSCKSQPPEDVDPIKYGYCPRCGRAWQEVCIPIKENE